MTFSAIPTVVVVVAAAAAAAAVAVVVGGGGGRVVNVFVFKPHLTVLTIDSLNLA